MSSPISTTGVPPLDNGHISPRLVFTMVGCLLAFAVIVVGFLLVARKSCCAPRRPDADASLPSYHDAQHHHVHPPATRRSCPVASLCDFQCPHCLKRRDKGDDHSPRVSLESLSSPPPPYPPAAHSPPSSRPRGLTLWLPRSGSSTSFNPASVTVATPATPATPARPPPPSYYYASRSPVGGPAPRYRQS